MDSTKLIAAVRQAAYIGDATAFPEQTDAKLLDELNARLTNDFGKNVTQAQQGYWLTTAVFSVTTGRFRIPSRSVLGGIYSVECQDANGRYYPLDEVDSNEIYSFEVETQTQYPRKFAFVGEEVQLLPTPAAATITVRVRFYMRPSTMVTAQNTTSTTDRGRITAVGTGSLTVNAVPFDYAITVPAAMTTSSFVDVVRPSGWHMPLTFDKVVSNISGTVMTPTDTSWLTTVQVGDYVRVAQQTDWPQLPADYHDALAGAAALMVLSDIGALDKARANAPKVQAEFDRFKDALIPRKQDNSGRLVIKNFGNVRSGAHR